MKKRKRRYIAHISADGQRKQTLAEHEKNVAELAAGFAAVFGRAEEARQIGLAHDMGKTSKEFQRRIKGESPICDHATAGAAELGKRDDIVGALCVAGHHGGLPDLGTRTSTPMDGTLIGRFKKLVPAYEAPEDMAVKPHTMHSKGDAAFSDSFLVRMLFSCLVDADFLDTETFMLGEARKHEYDSMADLLEKFRTYIRRWESPVTELDKKREETLLGCMEKGASPGAGLYSLTAPSGIGKTTASMGFALDHAVRNEKQRIIYVVPHTSIIDQSARIFREIFGSQNVLEYHSGYEEDAGEPDEEESLKRLAAENWDAPVIVTTPDLFFSSMYANSPSKCRKLHNIAGSVVILDEVQMLPVEHLKPVTRAIRELVSAYSVTAVLCTATQPELAPMFGIPVTELIGGKTGLYDALRRTTLEPLPGTYTAQKAAEFAAGLRRVLCIVNSDEDAHEIYRLLPEEGRYHLSMRMCPDDRQAVLEEVRDELQAGGVVRLVSTPIVEAGVNIDFPAVMREVAGLDSILQAAARCNRNSTAEAKDSKVYVFRMEGTAPAKLSRSIGAFTRAESEAGDSRKQLDSLESVCRYFEELYRFTGQTTAGMDRDEVVAGFTMDGEKWHSRRKYGPGWNYAGAMPFASVAKRFRLTEGGACTVYIGTGKTDERLNRIRDGCARMKDFREAGRSAVMVTEKEFQQFVKDGAVDQIGHSSGVLRKRSLYSAETGLKTDYDA